MDQVKTEGGHPMGRVVLTREIAPRLLALMGMPEARNVTGLTINCEPGGLVRVQVASVMREKQAEQLLNLVSDEYKLTYIGPSGLPAQFSRAITELQEALHTAANNGPIYRTEGNTAQADLCDAVAQDLRGAISALGGVPAL